MSRSTYRDALAVFQAGRHVDAAAILDTLILTRPGDIGIIELMAIIRIQQGRTADAEALLRRATGLETARPATFTNLAKLLLSTARIDEAERIFRDGIARFPDARELLVGAADYFMSRQRAPEAAPLLRRAVKLEPDNPRLQNNLAAAAREIGDIATASYALWRAYRLEGSEARLRDYLNMIQRHEIRVRDPSLAADIARGLDLSGIDPEGLVMPGLSALRADPAIATWLSKPNLSDAAVALPLLGRFVGAGVVSLGDFEQALTICRRQLMSDIETNRGTDADASRSFAVALARQGWLNEYVWAESKEERDTLDRLVQTIRAATVPDWTEILAWALYRPLSALGLDDSLWREAPTRLMPLVGEQIVEAAALAHRR